jgi:hypothetical protein
MELLEMGPRCSQMVMSDDSPLHPNLEAIVL